jgi:DNA-binding IclR family transcriptional regulator
MSEPRYPLASVDNALRILLCLRVDTELRVVDIARQLGVADSTAHRLLAALAHRGFVERDVKSRTYRAGPVLRELSSAAWPDAALRQWAAPAMRSAAEALGETIHLGVRRGRVVHYLDAIESTRAMRVVARTGRTLPAHCTSIGKAILAELSDGEVAELYAGVDPLAAATPRSITSFAELRDDLERCRRQGFAVNLGESEDDICSVAVAVRDATGSAVAAIGCAGPSSRLPPDSAPDVAAVLRRSLEDLGAATIPRQH